MLCLLLVLLPPCAATGQGGPADGPDRKYIPLSIEDLARQASQDARPQQSPAERLNERINLANEKARQARDYMLGPGDVVEVSVIGVPALQRREFELNGQGTVSLPYVGEVSLLGMTARQAEIRIASLFEVSLVVDPEVTVSVRSYKSQHFYIFGAVNKPGINQITGDTCLLDALTMAGGLTERAGRRVRVHHGGRGQMLFPRADPGLEESSDNLEIDLDDLLEKGDMGLNVRIRQGDVISVPERQEQFFYVLGDVPKPGGYTMRKNERVTLSKAIATAGGFLATASGKKTTIMRPNPDGVSATQIEVDAIAVVKGKARDVEISENDIVLVPGSASKTVGRSFVAGLAGFLTTMLAFGIR